MSWTALHEAHAIERMRLLFQFEEPISSKLLSKISDPIAKKVSEYHFDSVEPASSSVIGVSINPADKQAIQSQTRENGWVLKRHKDGAVVEELGLRDGIFGYMTTQYGRWHSLVERLNVIAFPALDKAIEVVDVSTVKLEYWDSFLYQGDRSKADATELLNDLNMNVPKSALAGESQWHSHQGWFEECGDAAVLVNRNFDAVDRAWGEGEPKRAINIYSMLEIRYQNSQVRDIKRILEDLEYLHKRSKALLGESIREEYCDEIGLKFGGE